MLVESFTKYKSVTAGIPVYSVKAAFVYMHGQSFRKFCSDRCQIFLCIATSLTFTLNIFPFEQ